MPRRPRGDVEAAPESDRFEDAPHPRDTLELFGHAEAERTLLDAYRGKRLAQSWIIGGREGIGKATLAWRLTRFLLAHPDAADPAVMSAANLSVGAEHPVTRRVSALAHGDIAVLRREWNSESKRFYTDIRVDDTRAVISRFQQAAAEGGWRIAIIDSADDLNRSAANALLKLIEEPPPRSLFLFVAHRPAQVLATIRSRSRMLPLSPLSPENVEWAVAGLGEPWGSAGQADIATAASRSGGSVRDALRLLAGDSLKLMTSIEQLLERLPDVDWRKVQSLADSVSKRENTADFEAVIAAIQDWMSNRVRDAAGQGERPAAKLAPYAQVWEKFARTVRETDIYNLDRRPLILNIFADLASATRQAA